MKIINFIKNHSTAVAIGSGIVGAVSTLLSGLAGYFEGAKSIEKIAQKSIDNTCEEIKHAFLEDNGGAQ